MPDPFDFVPPTFDFNHPKESEKFTEFLKAHPKATYIAKPLSNNQGYQTFLFKELTSDMPSMLSEKEMVVQLYVSKPLLLD